MPQIRPLADIVHFKYAHTYLLTYTILSVASLLYSGRRTRSISTENVAII